ncbi:hypothetical protein F4780DRAFT_790581 [Xylariomycetidae sp. FL0641]|nr:hypothetical protein F4780DRAFT_790581 [Xylariomycetidae sp. FL0641]
MTGPHDSQPAYGGEDSSNEAGDGRRYSLRSLAMSDDELADRQYRSRLFYGQSIAGEDEGPNYRRRQEEVEADSMEDADGEDATATAVSMVADANERKPWETLAIGDVGENLSYIERKNREIKQRRFIVNYCRENSPHEVGFHQKTLERLIEERQAMEDNEENNLPEDQREKGNRINKRLDTLRWALDTCRCAAEEVNIRAAIQGYETGAIPYTTNFTLIYAGHIVDTCPNYRSFCVDRRERLDRYYAMHGEGWLWQEPPLAFTGPRVAAKKAGALFRKNDYWEIGRYPCYLRYTMDKSYLARTKKDAKSRLKEMRKSSRSRYYGGTDSNGKTYEKEGGFDFGTDPDSNREVSQVLTSILDTGATFPMIARKDMQGFQIDLDRYAAQGVMSINVVEGTVDQRFYEMYVNVCDEFGKGLVGDGDDAVWQDQPRNLGGFYPVQVSNDNNPRPGYGDRLSGMVPFEACYISSAPTMRQIWLGEDRRDVLGASRMPGQLRFDSDKQVYPQKPQELEFLRKQTQAPDKIVFLHNIGVDSVLTDTDPEGARGWSELALGKWEMKNGARVAKRQKREIISTAPGKYGSRPSRNARRWQDQFEYPTKGEGAVARKRSSKVQSPEAEAKKAQSRKRKDVSEGHDVGKTRKKPAQAGKVSVVEERIDSLRKRVRRDLAKKGL